METEHYQVVIIGAGPAGIGAAVELARRGIQSVLLIDRERRVGGIPAKYHAHPGGVATFLTWQQGRILQGGDFALWLEEKLKKTTTQTLLNTQVLNADPQGSLLELVNPDRGCFQVHADTVIFACGSRDKTVVEKGWIVGQRPARILPTMQLLELLAEQEVTPLRTPITLGSDLIAWAVSAKLQKGGAIDPLVADRSAHPQTSWPARLFFRRWAQPRWRPIAQSAEIHGDSVAQQITLDGVSETCDGILVSGELVPNSELLIDAGVEVALPSRLPHVTGRGQLSHSPWFVAGNVKGGFHSAYWCFRHGRKIASDVVRRLARSPVSSNE